MLKLPPAFLEIPDRLRRCNSPVTPEELAVADAIRAEYTIPGQPKAWMPDIARGFRVAEGAKLYIEVGTRDKGNIAWLARTKLAKGATIIDVDLVDYPESDLKIKKELAKDFDYNAIRGDCLSDAVMDKIRTILAGRGADVIFCDSHYTYEHTLTEFTLYHPLVRSGGFLMFHDAEWQGDPSASEAEEAKKGKGLAIQQLDRFYPAWMIDGYDSPLYRPLPPASAHGHWGVLAVFTP